jgi:hypothetical protein
MNELRTNEISSTARDQNIDQTGTNRKAYMLKCHCRSYHSLCFIKPYARPSDILQLSGAILEKESTMPANPV